MHYKHQWYEHTHSPGGDCGPGDEPSSCQGPTGPQGPQGAIGPQGPQGAMGPEGPQGPMGPEGPQGLIGPEGPQGLIGPEGPQGPPGPSGLQGPMGPMGPPGPQGPVGSQGPIGQTGEAGATGEIGPTGPTGPTGVFDTEQTLFFVNGTGGTAPVSLGQEVNFRSDSLNVFVTPNPATVQIEARPNFSVVAYGGLYSTQPQSYSLAPGSVGTVGLTNFMPSFNVASGGGSLWVSSFGDYEINFTLRIAATANPGTLSAGVLLNGIGNFIPATLQTSPLSTTTQTIFQGSIIETLNPNSRLELAMQAVTSATFSLADNMNASLSVKRLSPFAF